MANYPMPGQSEFSADEEKSMRANNNAQNASGSPQWKLTPKGYGLMQGANIGSKLPDDATDRQ